MNASRGPLVTIVLLMFASVALVSGCSRAQVAVTAPESTVTAPPGAGTTIADQLYRAVRPRIGEPIGFIELKRTRPGESLGTGLTGRLADAQRSNPSWEFVGSLHGTRGRQLVTSHTFGDSSVLTLVMSPAISPKEDLKFDSPVTDLKLDGVEIARPPDLGRDNTIADQVYRLAKLQAVGSGGARQGGEYGRVNDVIDRRPEWRVGLRATAHQDGSARDFDFGFKDGSVLTLVTTQVSKQVHPVVAVEITRPSAAGR